MSTSTAHYYDAAKQQPPLTEAFSSQTNMTLEEENEKRVEASAAENKFLLEVDNLDGVNKKGAALNRHNEKEAERRAKQRQKTSGDIALLLDQAYADLDAANKALDKARDDMDAKYGDAWRGEVANEILDPDDIPQRGENESMEAYRERLEIALAKEMIDPNTGQVKDEYKNHPSAKIRDAAETMERRIARDHFQAKKDILTDPNTTKEQKLQAIKPYEELENRQEANEAADELKISGNHEAQDLVQKAEDAAQDEALLAKQEIAVKSTTFDPNSGW